MLGSETFVEGVGAVDAVVEEEGGDAGSLLTIITEAIDLDFLADDMRIVGCD